MEINALKVQDKINNLEKKSLLFPNFFVGVFYSGGLDGTNIKHPVFKCSLDGINFSTFNLNNNITDEYFTDPSLVYDETTEMFFISYTSYDTNRDCIILSSKDFVNWDKHYINLGYMVAHKDLHRWAPKLFIDDDEAKTLYLTMSVEYSKDIGGNALFKQVLFKCMDKQSLTFAKIGDISLSNQYTGYIDGSIEKNKDTYYFIVKTDMYDNENTGILQLYTTSNIEQTNSYTLANNYVNFEGLRLESPSLNFHNDKVNLYAEIYSFSHGGYVLQQDYIENLPNISKDTESLRTLKFNDETDFSEKNKYDARAGRILYLTNTKAKQIILNNTDISFANTSSPKIKDTQFDYKGMYPTGYTGAVVAFPDISYGLKYSGSDITIQNLINPFNVEKLKFILGDTNQKITIKKLNGENVDITFNNIGYSFKNVVLFDFNKRNFVNNNESIVLDDLLGNNGSVEITWLSNRKQNGIVMLDIIFTVQSSTSGEIVVATLPSGYKPAGFVQIANRNNIDLYITNAGEIKGNFSSLTQGKTLRVAVIYLINNG